MPSDVIHILISTDDNGCALSAALIVSIAQTTSRETCIHIFQNNLSSDNREKLLETAQKAGIQIQFATISGDFDFYIPKHWPLPTLFRLKADTILPDLDKVIYLDIDTLVYKDISTLWETDLGDNYIGACWGLDIHRDMGVLDPDKTVKEYFNAGVLLMNLKKMREDHIGEKCLQYMEKFRNEVRAADQDALNVVCAGKIKPLPLCWNWYISLERRSIKKLKKLYGKYWDREAAIVHFYAQYKPNRLFIYVRHPLATYRIWKKEKSFWKAQAQTPYTLPHEIKIKW